MRRRRSYDDAVPALREALLALDDADDDPAIAAAVTSALGVGPEVSTDLYDANAAADERFVELQDPHRSGRRIRLRFPNRYEVPPVAELEALAGIVGERVVALRRTEERRIDRQRARRRGALAEQLVGVTDIEAVAEALAKHVVPDVAAECRLLRRSVDVEDGGTELRVPPAGWPAVAFKGLTTGDPADVELAHELAVLALQAAAACLALEGELFARQVLERSLLPQALLPCAGLEVGSRYRPAGGTTSLAGGDFYDVVRGDGETTLIVG